MPDLSIAPKFLPFVQKKKRFKIAIGGRGSGKSMTFADLCLMDAQVNGIKTACFREFQNSIDDSVLEILRAEIERLGLTGFDCQQSKILLNGEEVFKFRGLARNPEGVKSMHGFERFWVEEAQTISAASLKNLIPTLRTDHSEIWMSGNLRSMADPFSQRFFVPFEKQLRRDGIYEDDMYLIVWVNYDDNPFFPNVLEQDRLYDLEHESKAFYNHVWNGEPYDEILGSIIPVEWFDAAIDAHIKLGFKPEGVKKVAFDPSDVGSDPAGYCASHGSVYTDICEITAGDVNAKLDTAIEKAIDFGAHHFTWDIGGMGTGLKREVSRLLDGTGIEYHLFNGAEEADEPKSVYQPVNQEDPRKRRTNKETFANRRASRYFSLADRFEKTYRAIRQKDSGAALLGVEVDELISLSSSIKGIDSIRSEVCRIPQKPNNGKRKQILSKPEMAAKPYQLPSPNQADCLMMNEYIPAPRAKSVSIKFAGLG